MSEEKKYEFVGKVEIGTDEYRDLIQDLERERASADKYRSESWRKDTEINKLKKEIEVLKECKEYVTEKCLDSFRLWKLDRMSQEDEDEE